MKNIGIFGSSGQLGSELHILLPTATPIYKSKVDFSKLTSLQELEEALAPDRYEILINAAALTDVNYCEESVSEAIAINANMPRILAEFCVKHGAHLIHISTDFVFDGTTAPYSDTSVANPVNVYGQTKLDAENAIQNIFSVKGYDFYTIIRTSSIFGVAHGRSNFIEKMIDAGLKKGTVKTNNLRRFVPTSARALAKRIAEQILVDKIERGLFHSVCGLPATQTEIANFIFQSIPSLQHVKIVGSDKQDDKKPARPLNSTLLSSPNWGLPEWPAEISAYLLWKGYSRPSCVTEVEADAPYSISKIWEKLQRKAPNYPELVKALREDRSNFLLGKKPVRGKKKSLADVFNAEPKL